jgi:NYN domain
MSRVAVFIDAGYLFAQGSASLWGAKQARSIVRLNAPMAIAELTAVAEKVAPSCSILRAYWYDGAISGRGPTLEQLELAWMDNVKLRLGFVNSRGEQKEVDSLIVTDLVELARNRAMSDAVLLSGDGDVRIGVQIAQSFGVRVHLLGIVPSRGSQSPQLIQECDTVTEWNAAMVGRLLTKQQTNPLVAVPTDVGVTASPPQQGDPLPGSPSTNPRLDAVTDQLVRTLLATDVAAIKSYWVAQQRGVPSEFDGKLIASGRTAMGRDLTHDEKRYMRKRFSTAVQSMTS